MDSQGPGLSPWPDPRLSFPSARLQRGDSRKSGVADRAAYGDSSRLATWRVSSHLLWFLTVSATSGLDRDVLLNPTTELSLEPCLWVSIWLSPADEILLSRG